MRLTYQHFKCLLLCGVGLLFSGFIVLQRDISHLHDDSFSVNIKNDTNRLELHISEHIKKDTNRLELYMGDKTLKQLWGVMTTNHTLFLADIIREELLSHDYLVEIFLSPKSVYIHDYYIIISAQMFLRNLPPLNKTFIYQVEQYSSGKRWFSQAYNETLMNSLGVLEYDVNNIFHFRKDLYANVNKLFYLPVGAAKIPSRVRKGNFTKLWDVLFYGDYLSSKRRQRMLKVLKLSKLKTKIVTEIFGRNMKTMIQHSRLVLNIHYYENALLETPRIIECLSYGTPVVSEAVENMDSHRSLSNVVSFFDKGSSILMMKAIYQALQFPVNDIVVEDYHKASQDHFSFMFSRFLMGVGLQAPSESNNFMFPRAFKSAQFVSISMPEFIDRHISRPKMIKEPDDVFNFEGIRIKPHWIGCALTYSLVARNALAQGRKNLTIFEDDAILPKNFHSYFSVINEYLNSLNGEWDIFSGLIADVGEETKIINLSHFKGLTFLTLDATCSMVFNIYNSRALRILESWNYSSEIFEDYTYHTVDRYLDLHGLKVITSFPFLVRHDESKTSTIWKFKNTQYNSLISKSNDRIVKMISHYYHN